MTTTLLPPYRKHPIGGGCIYCFEDGCENFVHREDAPYDYPYCDDHKIKNIQWNDSRSQYLQEKREFNKRHEELLELNNSV